MPVCTVMQKCSVSQNKSARFDFKFSIIRIIKVIWVEILNYSKILIINIDFSNKEQCVNSSCVINNQKENTL